MAAFTVIDHQELGVSQWAPSGNTTVASWTKSSIPDTYDHLMLKVSARTDSGYYGYVDVQLNADTTAGSTAAAFPQFLLRHLHGPKGQYRSMTPAAGRPRANRWAICRI